MFLLTLECFNLKSFSLWSLYWSISAMASSLACFSLFPFPEKKKSYHFNWITYHLFTAGGQIKLKFSPFFSSRTLNSLSPFLQPNPDKNPKLNFLAFLLLSLYSRRNLLPNYSCQDAVYNLIT